MIKRNIHVVLEKHCIAIYNNVFALIILYTLLYADSKEHLKSTITSSHKLLT